MLRWRRSGQRRSRRSNMSVALTVEFFFSPGSRYSYLAASQIARLEADTGCSVDWRPVSGGEIRKFRGRDPFQGQAVSGAIRLGLPRGRCTALGRFLRHSLSRAAQSRTRFRLLVRAAAAAKRLGRAADYCWRLCATAYGTDIWPIDRGACVTLAEKIGLAADLFQTVLDDPETEQMLAATAEEAFHRGAFGVPTFFVGEQMFWGNDRLVISPALSRRRHRLSPAQQLKARMRGDLLEALKAKRADEVTVLRSLLAAIDNAEAPEVRAERSLISVAPTEIDRLLLTDGELREVLLRDLEEREQAAGELAGVGQQDRADALLRQCRNRQALPRLTRLIRGIRTPPGTHCRRAHASPPTANPPRRRSLSGAPVSG